MVSLCKSFVSHHSTHLTPAITGSARSLGDTAFLSFHIQCRLGLEVSYSDKKPDFVERKVESLILQSSRDIPEPSSSYPHPAILRVRCQGAQDLQSSSELASEQSELTHNVCEEAPQERTCNANLSAEEETGGGDDNGHGKGKFGTGGDGSSDGQSDDDASQEEEEFGRLLDSKEVDRLLQSSNVVLPPDMAQAARTIGMRSLVLTNFIDLQGAKWPLGAAIRGSTMFRNRMLADQSFLFKILIEIAIDSGCATVAEVQKRGKDFWNEFELYMADLVVGVVVDVALVSMLAPFIQFRRAAPATGLMAKFSQAIQSLPSSVFEAATPGRRFTVQQRIASYFYKGIQYGAVGFGCGIIGQGIANSIMCLKRKMKKSDSDVPVPPLVKSAALWGVFLAVSSNTRYQIVNGLERVVEGSAVARRLPLVAMAFTVCIRFANNTYGGMQFVDWARWSGVQ